MAFDELDFKPRGHVPHSGWPIEWRELRPYFRAAHIFLGAVDERSKPPAAHLSQREIRADKTEVWSKEPHIDRLHAEELKVRENIDLHLGATVTKLLLQADQDAVTGLQVAKRGQTFTIKARNYVLACGGRENARLLLNAREAFPGFLGGPDRPLGRYYMGHLAGAIAAIEFRRHEDARSFFFERASSGAHVRRRLQVAEELQDRLGLMNASMWVNTLPVHDKAHGSGALSMIYLSRRLLAGKPAQGLVLSSDPSASEIKGHLWNVISHPTRSLSDGLRILRERAKPQRAPHFFLASRQSRYLLRYQAEQAPNPASKVTLDWEKDALGVRRLKADLRYSDFDISSVIATHQVLGTWMTDSGIGRLVPLLGDPHELVFQQARDGYHQIGLTRMAANPREGVVDADCKVFGVPNLFVAGSSVFPTSGEANPTLPAVALGLRLAAHLTVAHSPLSARSVPNSNAKEAYACGASRS